MNQHHFLATHDILVAASIAQQHGFIETQQALQEMAKSATESQVSWSDAGNLRLRDAQTSRSFTQ